MNIKNKPEAPKSVDFSGLILYSVNVEFGLSKADFVNG
jgi:hypothetical protein